MVPIGGSGPMAFFDCPGGHRVGSETRVSKHGPDFTGCYFPEIEQSGFPLAVQVRAVVP